MTDPLDSPPETSQEAYQQAASRNGTNPLPPLDLAAEVKLAVRAIEDVDMRLQAIQVACALITGLALLILALEIKELRG